MIFSSDLWVLGIELGLQAWQQCLYPPTILLTQMKIFFFEKKIVICKKYRVLEQRLSLKWM